MKSALTVTFACAMALGLLPGFVLAQVPSNQSKPTSSHRVQFKPSTTASERATALAQAQAIAEAQAAAQALAEAQAAAQALAETSTKLASPQAVPSTASEASHGTANAPALTSLVLLPLPKPEDAFGAVTAQELDIAQRVHQGQLVCELGAQIRVEHDRLQPGYFDVQGKGFRYRMRPVVTTTGAIRLEDAKAGAVWLQLANKSMLMDQKRGRRVADECAHPDQLATAQAMKTNPPSKLFDTSGMGR